MLMQKRKIFIFTLLSSYIWVLFLFILIINHNEKYSEIDNTTQHLMNEDDQNMINISTMDNLNKTEGRKY